MTSNGNSNAGCRDFVGTKGEKEIDLMREYPIISTENFTASPIFYSKTTKKQHLNNCKQTQLVFFAVLYYLRTIIYNKTII